MPKKKRNVDVLCRTDSTPSCFVLSHPNKRFGEGGGGRGEGGLVVGTDILMETIHKVMRNLMGGSDCHDRK